MGHRWSGPCTDRPCGRRVRPQSIHFFLEIAMKLPKVALVLFSVGTLSFLPLSGNATAQPPRAGAAHVDDGTLKDRVNTRLDNDASLKKFDIDASVANGVVTLTGKVRTTAERTRAANTAHVAGVTRVVNQITLDKDAGKSVTSETGA